MTIRGRTPRVRVDFTPSELFTLDAALRYYRDTIDDEFAAPGLWGPSIKQADQLATRLRRLRHEQGMDFPGEEVKPDRLDGDR